MPRYHELFKSLGEFCRRQFLADYTINMFGSDFRQGQVHHWNLLLDLDPVRRPEACGDAQLASLFKFVSLIPQLNSLFAPKIP
jgi:hypothetical protein